jgi:hypothetical protein
MIVHLSGDSDDDDSDGEDHTPFQPTCGKSTNIEATNIKASEDAVNEQEYALLKAMADADHEVRATSTMLTSQKILSKKTLRLIFGSLNYRILKNMPF